MAVMVGAAALGAVAGWLVAQRHLARHQVDLFSSRPLHRLAALGYLAGEATEEQIPLLRDYVVWEPVPALRRKGRKLLRQLSLAID